MNKIKKIGLCMAMAFSMLSISSLSAQAINIVNVDADSVIGKQFAFQPCVSENTYISIDTSYNNFSQNYTYASSFTQPVAGDDYIYRVELKQDEEGNYMYEDQENKIMPSIRYLYENVGIYEGEVINARVTLSEISDTYDIVVDTSKNESIQDELFDHYIYIDHAGIGFCAGRCKVKIEFLKQDGTLFTDFKGNITGTDLDSGQGIYNVTGVDTIYYKNNTIISSSENGVQANQNAADGMYDENGQFLMLIDNAVISFEWCTQKSTTATKWSEGRYISFQKAGFLMNETPGPSKTVDQEKAQVNEYNGVERLVYTISQYVPYQPIGYSYTSSSKKVTGQDYHYTKFSLIDTLPEHAVLDLSMIQVFNDANEDVTDYFTFTLEDDQLIILAKEEIMKDEAFYAHTYLFNVPVDIDEAYLSEFTDQGTYVPNSVELIYSQYNGNSDVHGGKDEAVTEFVYTIDSYHDQGSLIDSSKSDITGGDLSTFSYYAKDGYYITGLFVDGKEVESSMLSGSYTFNNITAYHTIEVQSEAYCSIITDVVNGSITENQYSIVRGDSRVIEYTPDENCYLDSIEVDEASVNIESFENAYLFNDIQQNHTIKVIYQPYQFIKTIAVNGTISGDNLQINDHTMTGSFMNLKAGSSKVVEYMPEEGYYLDSIEITEYEYNLNTKEYEEVSKKQYMDYTDMVDIAQSYTFENIDHSFMIKVIYKENPVIKITKTIEGDYNLANGIPAFIFKISGVDYTNQEHTYYRSISFKDEVEGNSLKTNSITIEDQSIPAGNYTIEELNTSRYSLMDVLSIKNCTITDHLAKINTRENEECHVEFVNSQTNFKDYSHNDIVINHIH